MCLGGFVHRFTMADDLEDGELDGCLPFREEDVKTPDCVPSSPTDMDALDAMLTSMDADNCAKAARRTPSSPQRHQDPYATYGSVLERLPSSSSSSLRAPEPFRAAEYNGNGSRPQMRAVQTRSWAVAEDATAEYTEAITTRPRRQYNAAIFMRQRAWRGSRWFEYLLEFRNGAYQFPQVDTERVRTEEATLHLIHSAGQRGMMYAPERPEQVESVFACVVDVDGTPHRVYRVPVSTTQAHRADRTLGIPPAMVWAAETELQVHVQLGMPAVLGKPVCTRSLKALRQLPLELQFASTTPPLVLYMGTSAATASAAAATGLKARASGVLGPGVYLTKWDRAEAQMREQAPGTIARVLLFAPLAAIAVLTPDAPVPVPDKPVNYVPDTFAAEWCVRDPTLLMLDFLLADTGSGTARVRPKRTYA